MSKRRVLVHKDTGIPVEEGETLTDFRGDTAIFCYGEEPRHPGSTGRAYVREDGCDPFGYYPSVYDLEWRDL